MSIAIWIIAIADCVGVGCWMVYFFGMHSIRRKQLESELDVLRHNARVAREESQMWRSMVLDQQEKSLQKS